MPCEFHRERPYPFQDLNPGCQFEGEAEFFGVADKSWCRFHLPMEDDDGLKCEKAYWDWDENEVTRFNTAVLAFIDKAHVDGKDADLTGVAFPGDVFFTDFTKDKPFPRACFFKAAFSGNADFREATFIGEAYFSGGVDEEAPSRRFRIADFAVPCSKDVPISPTAGSWIRHASRRPPSTPHPNSTTRNSTRTPASPALRSRTRQRSTPPGPTGRSSWLWAR